MSQLFSLEGKRVLLTGSARGIGFLLARGLGEAGADVIVNATTEQGAEQGAAKLRELGLRAHAKAFDVTQSAQVQQAVNEIEAEWGPIDILVNNAGIQRRRPFLEFPEQDWNDVIAVNQTAVFLVSQTVAKKWSIASAVRSSTLVQCRASWAATPSRLMPLLKAPSPC